LLKVRARGGRLFLIGVGGSAANCSHAAADFRTLCNINAHAFDSMAEFTALSNDHGWTNVFVRWLVAREVCPNDLLYVMSVGGGSTIYSYNLTKAMSWVNNLGSGVPIIGVAGRNGGALADYAKACVIVPTVNDAHITPHTESMQAVIWHLLVSHPLLKTQPTAWEGK
jgi:D-sedoheptulose 7-phosphate isomerase